MASATNPCGISAEEYSKFAIHVYQYLSYIKTVDIPDIEELKENNKLVEIDLTDNKMSKEKLLVFDLDETLVHCIYNDKDIHEADVFLDIKMPNGTTANTGFNIRPYWKEMMDELKDTWQIVVFTASCQNYADAILDYLDPENQYFQNRLYRETWWKTPDGVYVKDLRVFHQWDLSKIILVDNAVYSFGFQLDNGIPIFPYIQGKDDKQLLYLKQYIKIIDENDIIRDLKKTFKMSELYETDIDSFLDYYDQEEDTGETNNDILDQMMNNESFGRIKAHSFQSFAITKNRFSMDPASLPSSQKGDKSAEMESNLKEDWEFITRSVSDKFHHASANNVWNPFEENKLFDNESSNNSQKELSKTDAKTKIRKKKTMYSNIKKVQSVCEPTLFSDKNGLEAINNFLLGYEDGNDSSNHTSDKNTPKRQKGKKLKKKKRCNKMKEVKLGFGWKDDNDLVENPKPMQQLSLFAWAKYEKVDYNESISSEDDSDYKQDTFQKPSLTSALSFTFPRKNDLSKSAKVPSKMRNSSPRVNKNSQESDDAPFDESKSKRKVSKTTSSNDESSGDFERDDEDSGMITTSASKRHSSHISSSDNIVTVVHTNQNKVSNFGEVIKEETEDKEESSPFPRRFREDRKNSLGVELDILYQWTVNLHKVNSLMKPS